MRREPLNFEELEKQLKAGKVNFAKLTGEIETDIEFDWNDAAHAQGEARCHRYGRKNCVNS
jgi:hypothetical protein